MRTKLKDKKVKILLYTETEDSAGFPVRGYMPVHSNSTVWAYFKHLSASLYFASHQTNLNEEVIFTVNWLKCLRNVNTDSLKVLYDGSLYQVTRVDTYEDYKRDINLYAKFQEGNFDGKIIPYDPNVIKDL